MQNGSDHIKILFQQYLDNQLSVEAYKEFWAVLNNTHEDELSDQLKKLWVDAEKQPIKLPKEEWDHKMGYLMDVLKQPSLKSPVIKLSPVSYLKIKWAAAAVVLMLISAGVYILSRKPAGTSLTQTIKVSNNNSNNKKYLQPGSNKATLTLADGSNIILDSANKGMLAQQGNTKIIKLDDSTLAYTMLDNAATAIAYNTLTTPPGGQYQIILPDGTKVWLDAASSLKYPSSFFNNERKVVITGQAYFEVAKDTSKPFKVEVNNMEVEVLGTHFNINAYSDEDAIRTTLLEGCIKINQANGTNFLKPGQQAQLNKNGDFKLIKNADVDEAVAWKNGKFQFKNADLQTVMRQLGRWYNVDVEYKGVISRRFIGTIPRNASLSQVFKILELTGDVQLSFDGKKIIVSPEL